MLTNVFITFPYGNIIPVTCALSRCPEVNTIRTDYMTNNSLQISRPWRLHGGGQQQRLLSRLRSCPRCGGRAKEHGCRCHQLWLKQIHTQPLLCFLLLAVSWGTSATQTATQAQRRECRREKGQPVATDEIELSLCVMSPMRHHSGFE